MANGSAFDATLGQLYIEGEPVDLLGGLNFVGFQTSKLVKDGRAVARTVRPQAVSSQSLTDWVSFSRPDIDTDNEDFVLGATGSVSYRVRDVGAVRHVCVAIVFGTSPDAGTGVLEFPIDEVDGTVIVDQAKMFEAGGDSFGPEIGAVSNLDGAALVAVPKRGSDTRITLTVDQSAIVEQLGSPIAGDVWHFSFTVPVTAP